MCEPKSEICLANIKLHGNLANMAKINIFNWAREVWL